MKTGIFGGTFNPVHKGHLQALLSFIDCLKLDRTIITVTGKPPHKALKGDVCDEDRLEMTSLCLGQYGQIEDYEILKEGKSYTIDTVHYLKQKYPGDEFFLFMGSDMILNIEEVWHRFEDIFKEVTIVVFSRTGKDFEKLTIHTQYLTKKYHAKILLFEKVPFEISSSEIRQLIKENKPFEQYLTKDVVTYIKENGLYQ